MITWREAPTILAGLFGGVLLIAATEFPEFRVALLVIAAVLFAGSVWFELVFLPRRDLRLTAQEMSLGAQKVQWDHIVEVELLPDDGELEWLLRTSSGPLFTIMNNERALRPRLLKGLALYVPGFPVSAFKQAAKAKRRWSWRRDTQPSVPPDAPATVSRRQARG